MINLIGWKIVIKIDTKHDMLSEYLQSLIRLKLASNEKFKVNRLNITQVKEIKVNSTQVKVNSLMTR